MNTKRCIGTTVSLTPGEKPPTEKLSYVLYKYPSKAETLKIDGRLILTVTGGQ